jgi:hypothetical protein
MSLLPAFFSALRRKDDSAPLTEAETDSGNIDSHDNVFDLVPPRTDDAAVPDASAASGRNVHPIGVSDLSRLSIDNDGRLYWDGKPVEVRRSILMSRAQIVGASLIAAFVVIGAVGAAIQGSAAIRDWACRLGWTTSYCTLPGAKPQNPSDIPA